MPLCHVCKHPTKTNRSREKFCSQACSGKSRRRRVTKICPHCLSQFEVKQSSASRRTYCSFECEYAGRDRKITLNCKVCDKQFKVKRNRINPQFCSITCQGRFQRGKLLPYMRDPITKEKGIKKMRISNTQYSFSNPTTNTHGYPCIYINQKAILLHRIVAEKALCRKLERHEVIHHIDEDISNYSVENLYLFQSSAAHMRYHRLVKKGLIGRIHDSNL